MKKKQLLRIVEKMLQMRGVKKTPSNVDNFSDFRNKRYQLILQIQEFNRDGCSAREIARRLGIGRNTVSKYKIGDPRHLCQDRICQSKLDVYRDHIVDCLQKGYSKSKTIKSIYEQSYSGSKTNAFDYLKKVEHECGIKFEPQPYVRTMTESLKYKTGSKGKYCDYITRNGIFRYLWMDAELDKDHRDYIFEHYPILYKIKKCIKVNIPEHFEPPVRGKRH